VHSQIQFLSSHVIKYWRPISLAFLLATLSVALDHASPWILKLLVDGMQTGSNPTQLLRFLLILALCIVVSGIFGYLQRMLTANFSRTVESHLRVEMFTKLLHQPRSFFLKSTPGDLMQNLVQDLDKLQDLTGPALLHFYRTALTLIFSTVLLFLLSPSLAVVGFVFFVTLSFASLKLMTLVYAGHKRNQKYQASLSGYMRDFLHGIAVVKSSSHADFFNDRFEKYSLQVRDNALGIAKLSASIWPLITLLCGLGIAICIAWGAVLVQRGTLGAGSLAAAVLYLVRAQYPLVGLGIMTAMVQRGRASLDRIIDLYRRFDASSIQKESSDPPPEFKSLELCALNFSFEDSSTAILSDISFKLKVGGTLGIAGSTGSGKSTLAKIICGVIPPPPDSVLVNELDLRTLHDYAPHGSWRNWFGYAPQDGFLFSWTIAENIAIGNALGNAEAAPAAIEDASVRAGLGHDITLFPQGLSSILGEKGVNLSGGQRQRVGLARAFLSGAPVLVLDDVLCAVDPETERRVVQTIRESKPSHAMVVVSHRYSTLLDCDEIIYLENGRIIERGTHAELLLLGGIYARNWQIQSMVNQ